jgi:tetratricopeptide (TPR) repeat protein
MPARRRWWWLPAVVVVPVAILAGISWYVHHSAPAWTFRRGMEAFAGNDLDGVSAAAEALRGLEGYEPHVHLLAGIVLLRSGRLMEAIGEFGYAKDHPDIAPLAYALSGEALYKAGRFRDADRILTRAVQLDPSQTDAHRWLATLYYDIGAMGHALAQLKIVAEQAPADPRPSRTSGLIDKDFEKYDEAIAEYRESLRRDPDQAGKHEILVEIAECLVKLRRYAEALQTLDPCPRSAHSLWLQAECSYAQGDKAAAGSLLAEALQLTPNHLDALHLRATIDQEAGNLESAAGVLRQAAEYYPKEYKVRYRLAQLYQRLGRAESAREQNEAMAELRTLRNRFSDLHEKAIAEAANVELRYELGTLAVRLDKPELARTWFLAALGLDPDHQGARLALQAMSRKTSEPAAKGVK